MTATAAHEEPTDVSPAAGRSLRAAPLVLTGVAAGLLVLYVGLLAIFSGTGFPAGMALHSHWPSLIDKPVGEDGYYMLTVAHNIATQGKVLYNRGMPATGIQPLATLLFAALDWVVQAFGGGADALIRSVMLTGVLLLLLFAWQLSRIATVLAPSADRRCAATLAALLTLGSFTLFRLFTYGLETGVYLVTVAACFLITTRIAARQHTTARDTVLLGLAAGLAGEARIDFGAIFAILLCSLLLYRWIRWTQALVAGGLALLMVSPWFLFVHHVSGSWLPSSGHAESTWIARKTVPERLGSMAQALSGELMPWCYAVVSHATVLAAAVSAVVIVALLAVNGRLRLRLRTVLAAPLSRMWLVCLLSLVPVYVLLFNANHFYYRYVAPVAVLAIPVAAAVLAQAGWVRRHLVATAGALAVAFAAWAAASLHMGRVGNSQTIAAGYIHRYFPVAHVGSFQSGVVGFFNPNVDNLDGKLNAGALAAKAAHRLPEFLDRQHIDVLVDWPSVIHANLPSDYLQREWQPCPVPVAGGGESICLIRKAGVHPTDQFGS